MGQMLRKLVLEHTELMHLASDASAALKDVQDKRTGERQQVLLDKLCLLRDAFWVHLQHEREELFARANQVLEDVKDDTERLEVEQASLIAMLDDLCNQGMGEAFVDGVVRFFEGFEAHIGEKADWLMRNKNDLFPDEQMAG